ncbi:MAG: hypothetical protein Q4C56_04795 [Peptococcaceae bacterium]|nr:hypothetical protein [Peptococcaceae bacterium]
MDLHTILVAVAVILLAIGLGIKFYGMAILANQKIPAETRMNRYKKTVPLSYGLLLPTIVIIVYLFVTK